MTQAFAPICRRPGWFANWIDEELIMMNASSRFYLSLTGAGGRIWELLARPLTVEQLCDVLAGEFAIPPAGIRPEVVAFLGRMRQLEAIDVDARQLA